MAARRQMLKSSEETDINIDDMLKTVSGYEIESPINIGKIINFELLKFEGDSIINDTFVYEKNDRAQDLLDEHSLAPLINSIKTSNQISPAVGRRVDGKICVIYGSCRRMGTYYANKTFSILVSDNISDEEALLITKAENISTEISLIERGRKWLELSKDNHTTREISKEFEDGKVSHTLIAEGIKGAKLPLELIQLYPSVSIIGKSTINKLVRALSFKKVDLIVEHIQKEHTSIIESLRDSYTFDQKIDGRSLTKAIMDFAVPVFVKDKEWPKGISLNKEKNGSISGLKFDKPLTKAQSDKLQAFMASLIGS